MLTCGLWLILIVGLTTGLAWTVWSVTVDRQADSEQRKSHLGMTLEGELATERITSSKRDSTKDAARRSSAENNSALSAPASPGPDLPGPLLGGVGAGAICLAGLFAARLVLRRYRGAPLNERRTLVPENDPAPHFEEVEVPFNSTSQWPEPEVSCSEGPREPDKKVHDDAAASAALRPSSDAHAFNEGEDRNRRLSQPEGTVAPSTRVEMHNAASVDAALTLPAEPLMRDTRQRLYERRATPRVRYVVAGTVELPDVKLPVTVLDVSETGVRCQADQLPLLQLKNGEYVRVAFPAGATNADVKARVAWRKSNGDDVQLGLSFVGLSGEDRARVRGIVSARLAG